MRLDNPGAPPAKELWFPVTQTIVAGGLSFLGVVPCAELGAANDDAKCSFHIPHDFMLLSEAFMVVIPSMTNAAAAWTTQCTFAGDGEAYNTHNLGDAASTYNVTNNEYFEVNYAVALVGLAAGDRGGASLILRDAAHDVKVIGLRIRYT